MFMTRHVKSAEILMWYAPGTKSHPHAAVAALLPLQPLQPQHDDDDDDDDDKGGDGITTTSRQPTSNGDGVVAGLFGEPRQDHDIDGHTTTSDIRTNY
ncbi:hypothetical protein KIN20_036985 [Parelaphostrongylus tenuis]|uniref:Uncharacterized protein n=1 Tax=Parelaphostrongylus tenuis TaxID=148309 RepID=A0AAD5RDL8_PARTN|nr:hypothetical protein KIN20_036985 [Parelaphostrongylus tenuis]